MKTRLGKRLKALFTAIPSETDCLYDLCCDHGALGRAVLETRANCHVVFNDIHPEIMARLASLLNIFSARNFTLSICPAEKLAALPFQQATVILAGIGDEQCIRILQHLSSIESLKNAHFIISPATKVQNVRAFLSANKASLLKESTVTENKRTYESIEVMFNQIAQGNEISEFAQCWNAADPDHYRHLEKLVAFYAAQQSTFEKSDYQRISRGYYKILKKFNPLG